ncbi:MAG: hypothetical protein CSA53_06680 [Gammaproteobacteria bacterium]|nr:MAG: hypothetical protein CSA53_06680 [Gammaproteobacteria bacterium]
MMRFHFHTIVKRPAPRLPQKQDGVVLLLALILLLITAFVGYSVMDTSTMEARMAAIKEGQALSFQGAESIISQSLQTTDMVGRARAAHLSGGADPIDAYTFSYDADLSGRAEMEYTASTPAYGEDWTRGFSNQHFELNSEVVRSGGRFQAHHVQGVRVLTPGL